jgi:hypothetical protein
LANGSYSGKPRWKVMICKSRRDILHYAALFDHDQRRADQPHGTDDGASREYETVIPRINDSCNTVLL